MNWNYLRIEKRILSLVLVLVMSVSLLSGCGHSNGNAKKEVPVTKEVQKQEESVSAELAKANEAIILKMKTLRVKRLHQWKKRFRIKKVWKKRQ